MKTAEEILKENATDVADWTSGFKEEIIEAMKLYAKEALQEAIEKIESFYLTEGLESQLTSEILSLINNLK